MAARAVADAWKNCVNSAFFKERGTSNAISCQSSCLARVSGLVCVMDQENTTDARGLFGCPLRSNSVQSQ